MSDSTPDLGIDRDTLNESEQQLIDLFESRRTAASGESDVAPVSAEELAEPPGTPGPAAGSTAASETPPTVEGQSGVSETAPSPEPDSVAVGEQPPVESEPTGDESALPSPAFTFAGVEYSPDQVARAIQVHDWYNRLNNDQVQSVDALLSGQYRLVPAFEAAPVPPTTVQPPATSPASSAPDQPAVTQVDDAGEWLDPRAQAEVARLTNELNQIRQQFTGTVTPLVQSQADQQLRARMSSIETATNAFRDQYTLEDSLMETIGRSVVQAGILPSLISQHNGNVEAATRQAYEMMFWTTPSFRDSYMQSKSAADLASLAEQNKQEADKHRKMTALTASGGSVPRRDPQPNNKDDRHSAMVELIRSDMAGN